MLLISIFNKVIWFSLCAIDIFRKCTWVIPLKDKNAITITNACQNILIESDGKPNKILLDKGSEFYNKLVKWNETYNYLTSISTYMYIDKLDDIVNKFNNTYHSTNKEKPVNVVPSTYIDSCKEINNEDPKFKIGATVTISKYNYVFGKVF